MSDELGKKKNVFRALICFALLFLCSMFTAKEAYAASKPGKTTGVVCVNTFTTSAQLSYNKVNNAKGYEISLYDSSGKLVKTQYTAYTKVSVAGLAPGGKYIATVRAYSLNSNGTKRYGEKSQKVKFATIPSKIKGVKAISATNTTVTLEWKYDKNATGYYIYVYNKETSKWQFLKMTTDNKFVAENMEPGVNYKYVIKPYVYHGGKRYVGAGYSKSIMAQPGDVPKIETVEQNYSSIKVKWNKAVGATGYRVAIYDEKGKCLLFYHTGNTSATFKNLEFRKKYRIVVRSYRLFSDGKRVYGGFTSTSRTTKLGLVKNIVQKNATDTSITLSFGAVEGANGYGIYLYNKNNGKKLLKGVTSENYYEITGLRKGKEYEVIVAARLTVGDKTYFGTLSEPICAYTYPQGVTNYTISDNTEKGFTVNWDAVPLISYYRVYYKDSDNNKYVFAGNTKKTVYTFDKFKSGTQSFFVIVAVCNIGGEEYVCPKTIGYGYTTPDQVKLNGGYTKEGTYVIEWTQAVGATGYDLYKYDDITGKWIKLAKTDSNTYTYTITDEKDSCRFKVRPYVELENGQLIIGDFSDNIEINAGRRGIDVSKWQGEIDWKKVAGSGIEFVIIKVGGRGYGKAGTIYEDPYFQANIEGALANGIDVGIYFFSTAISEEEAVEEAKWTLNRIKGYNVTYPIVFDYEGYDNPDYRSYGQTRTNRSNYAIAFLDYVRSKGYLPMMYASQYYYNTQWDTDRLSDYNLWVAKYPSGNNGQLMEGREPKIEYPYAMWQYSSTGKVDGIQASNGAYRNVDMNYQYTSFKK